MVYVERVGEQFGGATDHFVVRYNADGSPDTGFGGGDGQVSTDPAPGLPEEGGDVLYAIVRRTIGGVSKRYIERLETRDIRDGYFNLDSFFVDSGLTLQYLLDVLQRRNPRDLRVVALLKKENPEAIDVQVDLVGFTIPDEFVIGYGLDYAGKYRNLPYVAVLDPRIYARE